MKVYVLISNGERPNIIDVYRTKESAEAAKKEVKFPLFKEISRKEPIANFIKTSILMDSRHNPKINRMFYRKIGSDFSQVKEFDDLFENIKQACDPENKCTFKELLKSLKCDILSEEQLRYCFENIYSKMLTSFQIIESELCSIWD